MKRYALALTMLALGAGAPAAQAQDETFCSASAHEPILVDGGTVDALGHLACENESPYSVSYDLCLEQSSTTANPVSFGTVTCTGEVEVPVPDGGSFDFDPIYLPVPCEDMPRTSIWFRSKFTAHWNIPSGGTNLFSPMESLLTSQTAYSQPAALPCPSR